MAKANLITDPSAALSKLSDDLEKLRQEFVDIPKRLKSESAESNGALGNHKKRLCEIYGLDPKALPMIDSLVNCVDGRRSVVWRQVKYLVAHLGLDNQPEIPGLLDEHPTSPEVKAESNGAERLAGLKPTEAIKAEAAKGDAHLREQVKKRRARDADKPQPFKILTH